MTILSSFVVFVGIDLENYIGMNEVVTASRVNFLRNPKEIFFQKIEKNLEVIYFFVPVSNSL